MKHNMLTPNKCKNERQYKVIEPETQLQTIFQYLEKNTATASMVAEATGIYQKNICRYKRDLEKSGKLWETVKMRCQKTGFSAWYLTTDSEKAPDCFSKQLNLF